MQNWLFECDACGHKWVGALCGKKSYEIYCPECNSEETCKIGEGHKTACGSNKNGHKHCCCGKHQ